MKKCLFLFTGFCFVISAIGQTEIKVPFAEMLKFSASDTLIKVEQPVKKQFSELENARLRQKEDIPIRIFLNAVKAKDNNSIAMWIAAHLEQNLFKVNLSVVISKYIGETEKNLDKLFAAASSNSVLFFDEADALFGKRTTVKDSHDKYANQEVSYFMNHVKKFKGTVFIQCKKNDCIDSVMLQTFTKIGRKQE